MIFGVLIIRFVLAHGIHYSRIYSDEIKFKPPEQPIGSVSYQNAFKNSLVINIKLYILNSRLNLRLIVYSGMTTILTR